MRDPSRRTEDGLVPMLSSSATSTTLESDPTGNATLPASVPQVSDIWAEGPGAPESSAEPPPPAFVTRLVLLLHEVWFGCWYPDTWTPASLLRLFGVFVLAGVCSWLGITLSRQSEGVATIWLSNGIIFGLLVTQPPRIWLAYFIAGEFPLQKALAFTNANAGMPRLSV